MTRSDLILLTRNAEAAQEIQQRLGLEKNQTSSAKDKECCQGDQRTEEPGQDSDYRAVDTKEGKEVGQAQKRQRTEKDVIPVTIVPKEKVWPRAERK